VPLQLSERRTDQNRSTEGGSSAGTGLTVSLQTPARGVFLKRPILSYCKPSTLGRRQQY